MNLNNTEPVMVDMDVLIATINKGMKMLGDNKNEPVKLDESFLENIELDLITLYELKDKLNIKFAEA